MIKKFEQYNESLRDKMTPVSDEDIKKKMGEEKYKIWKVVQDAKDTIKPPYEFHQFTTGSADDKNPYLFGFHVWFIRFTCEWNGETWKYIHNYNGESEPMYFYFWDDVYRQMVLDTNKSFNKEIKQHEKETKRHQDTIDDIKKELEKINNDKEV